MELMGKTALVTGSAHRIGKAVALQLAKKGTNVIVHYGRSEDKARKTVSELMDLGVDSTHIQSDLSELDSIELMFNKIAQNFENLDIVVNSAASFVKEKFSQITVESWEKSLNTNLRAPLFITQKAVNLMHDEKAQYSKLIVNISDLSGLYPWKGFTTHGISKAGLIHLTKITARELSPSIRVNAIVPGPIIPPAGMNNDDKKWKEMIDNIPLQKSGNPEQIGNTVVFLAQNDFITGSIVKIDGGESLIGPKNH